MRECSKCGIEKELEQFPPAKRYKEGRKRHCRECESIRNKKYYEENKERYKEWFREYYRNNREKFLERRKEYVQDETIKEHLKEYGKKYYHENKEVMKETHTNWVANNKERWNEYQREYAKMKRKKLKEQNEKHN